MGMGADFSGANLRREKAGLGEGGSKRDCWPRQEVAGWACWFEKDQSMQMCAATSASDVNEQKSL